MYSAVYPADPFLCGNGRAGPSRVLNLTQDLNINREALMVASRQVKMLSGRNVQAAAQLCFVMANHIARPDADTAAKEELNEQQARLAEAIFERKQAEENYKVLESKYKLWPIL